MHYLHPLACIIATLANVEMTQGQWVWSLRFTGDGQWVVDLFDKLPGNAVSYSSCFCANWQLITILFPVQFCNYFIFVGILSLYNESTAKDSPYNVYERENGTATNTYVLLALQKDVSHKIRTIERKKIEYCSLEFLFHSNTCWQHLQSVSQETKYTLR